MDFVVCFDVNHTGWKLETKVKETAPKLKQPAFVLSPLSKTLSIGEMVRSGRYCIIVFPNWFEEHDKSGQRR